MDHAKTAVILIGYQNDYFAEDGILQAAIKESVDTNNVLDKTLKLIDGLKDSDTLLIQTPIVFTKDYSELKDPVGILALIKENKAFRAGSPGSEIIPELANYGERVKTVPGKRGLNAFSNTTLEDALSSQGITTVVLAGAVTSVCIDSTARSAIDRGYRVTVLSDCTAGRSDVEQNFYCDTIFPLYANVCTTEEFLAS